LQKTSSSRKNTSAAANQSTAWGTKATKKQNNKKYYFYSCISNHWPRTSIMLCGDMQTKFISTVYRSTCHSGQNVCVH
jgi:hypothetical protein